MISFPCNFALRPFLGTWEIELQPCTTISRLLHQYYTYYLLESHRNGLRRQSIIWLAKADNKRESEMKSSCQCGKNILRLPLSTWNTMPCPVCVWRASGWLAPIVQYSTLASTFYRDSFPICFIHDFKIIAEFEKATEKKTTGKYRKKMGKWGTFLRHYFVFIRSYGNSSQWRFIIIIRFYVVYDCRMDFPFSDQLLSSSLFFRRVHTLERHGKDSDTHTHPHTDKLTLPNPVK